MAIIIHYVPVHNFFWAEAGKEHKDTLKSAGFNWCDTSYGPKWCPPPESGINKKWWTKNYANAYKLKDYLSPAATQAINEWIESGSAEKDITEAETPISIHYITETKVFFADAGKRFAKTLKDAGFRWHDIDWSEHDISKCKACANKVPSKKWWTDNIDAAVNLINFTDAGAKEVLNKYMLLIDQSRASDYNIDIPSPKGLKPYNYQKAGIAWAISRQNSLIADEMGLGKTIQGISVINLDESIKTVVILCLASLRINWKKECEMWLVRPHKISIVKHVDDIPKRKASDEETVSILIIGFPSVRGEHGEELYQKIMTFNYDLLIIDESHNLKNPKALQTRNILGWTDLKEPFEEHNGIAHGARKKIYLTGTPIKNRPIEGWTIFHSLAPEIFDNYIRYAFRYCDAYWENIWNGKETVKTLNVKGSSHSDELQRKLRSSIMIRRLKEDVLNELPPKTRQLIVLEPDTEARKLIEEEKRKSVSIIDKLDKIKENDTDEKYRNLSAALEEQKAKFEEISKIRHQLAILKIDAVYEHIESMLEGMEEGKDKIILFAHHRDVIEIMQKKFEKYNPVILYGGMSDDQKNKSVEAFQNDPKVKLFIGSISAAGTGLTLTASSTVIFCELDWSPSQILQAEDRAHRIGQKDNVLVQHLVYDGSLDAKIVKTFLNKMDVIGKVLDVGAELKPITIEQIPKVEPIPEPSELKPIQIPTIVKVEYGPGQPTESGGVVIDSGPSKPGKPSTKPTILEYTYTDEQKQAALQGLQMLAEVCDYAQTKDMMGFNIAFAKIGHKLASRDELTDNDMSGDYGAVHILNVHRRQMPDWIRDILGLWPNKEKAIYTPKQKNVMYMVAQVLNEMPNKDDIFDEEELQLIKQIAETDVSEKGDKTFSDKILFVFRNILSEHWTEIDPNVIALLEHVGIKKAQIRGKRGQTKIEPTIEGEEELAEEKISEEPEEETPSSEPPESMPVDFIEMGKQAYINGIKRVPALDIELQKELTSINDNEARIAVQNWLKGWDTANVSDTSWIDFVQMGKEAFLAGKPSVPLNDEYYNKNIEYLRLKNGSKIDLKKLTLDWMKGWREAQDAQVEVAKENRRKEQQEPNLVFHARTDTGSYEMKIWQGKEEGEVTYYFKDLEKEYKNTYKNQDIKNVAVTHNTFIEASREKGIDYKILVDKIGVMSAVEVKPHLVFEASTKGNKYTIRVLFNPVDELYTIKDYTRENEVGTATGIKKEQIANHLIQNIVNAAKIDGIHYIIKGDNIGIDKKEIKKLIEQPIKPVVFPEPEPPKVISAPPESKPIPEPQKIITKYSEPQKGGIFTIIVYFSNLPESTIKKEFSNIEQQILTQLKNNLIQGKTWTVLSNENINELKSLIEKHISLVPQEYITYINSTGLQLGKPSPVTKSAPEVQQKYTKQQKEIAHMSIAMLKQHFDNMSKKEKSLYTDEWISNIDKLSQLPQPITDSQVDSIINVIKKHRKVFEGMGVFEQLGVKFVGRPPK